MNDNVTSPPMVAPKRVAFEDAAPMVRTTAASPGPAAAVVVATATSPDAAAPAKSRKKEGKKGKLEKKKASPQAAAVSPTVASGNVDAAESEASRSEGKAEKGKKGEKKKDAKKSEGDKKSREEKRSGKKGGAGCGGGGGGGGGGGDGRDDPSGSENLQDRAEGPKKLGLTCNDVWLKRPVYEAAEMALAVALSHSINEAPRSEAPIVDDASTRPVPPRILSGLAHENVWFERPRYEEALNEAKRVEQRALGVKIESDSPLNRESIWFDHSRYEEALAASLSARSEESQKKDAARVVQSSPIAKANPVPSKIKRSRDQPEAGSLSYPFFYSGCSKERKPVTSNEELLLTALRQESIWFDQTRYDDALSKDVNWGSRGSARGAKERSNDFDQSANAVAGKDLKKKAVEIDPVSCLSLQSVWTEQRRFEDAETAFHVRRANELARQAITDNSVAEKIPKSVKKSPRPAKTVKKSGEDKKAERSKAVAAVPIGSAAREAEKKAERTSISEDNNEAKEIASKKSTGRAKEDKEEIVALDTAKKAAAEAQKAIEAAKEILAQAPQPGGEVGRGTEDRSGVKAFVAEPVAASAFDAEVKPSKVILKSPGVGSKKEQHQGSYGGNDHLPSQETFTFKADSPLKMEPVIREKATNQPKIKEKSPKTKKVESSSAYQENEGVQSRKRKANAQIQKLGVTPPPPHVTSPSRSEEEVARETSHVTAAVDSIVANGVDGLGDGVNGVDGLGDGAASRNPKTATMDKATSPRHAENGTEKGAKIHENLFGDGPIVLNERTLRLLGLSETGWNTMLLKSRLSGGVLPLETTFICFECGRDAVAEKKRLMKCKRCKVASYCDTSCQGVNWANHKRVCKLVGLQRSDQIQAQNIFCQSS